MSGRYGARATYRNSNVRDSGEAGCFLFVSTYANCEPIARHGAVGIGKS